MTRAARDRRVWFVEEPVVGPDARLGRHVTPEGVRICVPEVPEGLGAHAVETVVAGLVAALGREDDIADPCAWLYTPMMLPLAEAIAPRLVVYDCMDELSAFRFAPPEMRFRERALFARAELVFTGGRSLWEAKRGNHHAVHLFPSSVDIAHFAAARTGLGEPASIAGIPHPRLGWVGVIDERMDLDLLASVATRHPDWHIVLLGPVAKIDPASIPDLPNVHTLGPRTYAELPAYLAHFDVAIMPFARNEATRFISPTKTPEYLAAGLPVVSTPIRDVVRDYGVRGLVEIAPDADAFAAACARALWSRDAPARLRRVDAALAENSWDDTWVRIDRLLEQAELRLGADVA
jgi:glycosyltransferase involved in cell wall biosynthesis